MRCQGHESVFCRVDNKKCGWGKAALLLSTREVSVVLSSRISFKLKNYLDKCTQDSDSCYNITGIYFKFQTILWGFFSNISMYHPCIMMYHHPEWSSILSWSRTNDWRALKKIRSRQAEPRPWGLSSSQKQWANRPTSHSSVLTSHKQNWGNSQLFSRQWSVK